MAKWTPDSNTWRTTYQDKGRDLRLEVEPSPIPKATAWYWRVINEELKVVRDGCQKTPGAAKAAATKAAKAYIKGGEW